ncbi:hypothetical protein [Cryobacterium aureum]|uniref:hypothetical protein n=1 Tax=Cryobacterium aureum TaxID=995037 RepID=UPI000CF56AA8|nr:hypothetical protein [Cryobacterium aureum]
MIDYETIFIDEHNACEASFPPDQLFTTEVQQASLDAGIAAVVAAAKAGAITGVLAIIAKESATYELGANHEGWPVDALNRVVEEIAAEAARGATQ